MELEVGFVSRKVDGNCVVGRDGERTGAVPTAAADFQLLVGQRDVEVLGFFQDRRLDFLFRTGAVSCGQGLVLEDVFKLIVGEKGGMIAIPAMMAAAIKPSPRIIFTVPIERLERREPRRCQRPGLSRGSK